MASSSSSSSWPGATRFLLFLSLFWYQLVLAQHFPVFHVDRATTPARHLFGKRDALDDVLADQIPRDQCRWTNCGQGCPSGWTHVHRRDTYRTKFHERMVDDTGCSGGARNFCCPPGPEPFCQWLFHNGGKCNPSCTKNTYQIASTNAGCNNGLSQLACCSLSTNSGLVGDGDEIDGMKIWKKCEWHWKEPSCASDLTTCPKFHGSKHATLVLSWLGSGSTHCKKYVGKFTKVPAQQAYCCEPPTDDSRWEDCAWTTADGEGKCDTACPAGKYKIALDDDETACKTGSRAYCCRPYATTAAKSKEEAQAYLLEMLKQWADNPVCPNTVKDPFTLVSYNTTAMGNSSSTGNGNTGQKVPGNSTQPVGGTNTVTTMFAQMTPPTSSNGTIWPSNGTIGSGDGGTPGSNSTTPVGATILFPNTNELLVVKLTTGYILRLSRDPVTDPTALSVMHTFDEAIQPRFPALSANKIRIVYNKVKPLEQSVQRNIDAATDSVDCLMQQWNDWAAKGGQSAKTKCKIRPLNGKDSYLYRDENDPQDDPELGPDYGGAQTVADQVNELSPVRLNQTATPNPYPAQTPPTHPTPVASPNPSQQTPVAKRNADVHVRVRSLVAGLEHLSSLVRREGQPRAFLIDLGNGRTVTVHSAPYINGDHCHNLEDASGNTQRFYLVFDENDCTIYSLGDDAPDSVPMHSEHIIELQTIANFIEFMVRQQIPARDTHSQDPTLRLPLRFAAWEAEYSTNSSPIIELFELMGSINQPDDMVNLEGPVNNMKMRMWSLHDHIANRRWRNDFVSAASQEQFSTAMEAFQQVRKVWLYLNDGRVLGHAQDVHTAVVRLLDEFERLYRQQRQNEGHPDPGVLNLSNMWRTYINGHMVRVVANSRAWQRRQLQSILIVWQNHLEDMWDQFTSNQANPPAEDIAEAFQAIEAIEAFIENLDQQTTFPANAFQ